MLIAAACMLIMRALSSIFYILCLLIAVACTLIMRVLSSVFLYSLHVDRCCLHNAHQGSVCVQVGGVRTDSQSLPAGQWG